MGGVIYEVILCQLCECSYRIFSVSKILETLSELAPITLANSSNQLFLGGEVDVERARANPCGGADALD